MLARKFIVRYLVYAGASMLLLTMLSLISTIRRDKEELKHLNNAYKDILYSRGVQNHIREMERETPVVPSKQVTISSQQQQTQKAVTRAAANISQHTDGASTPANSSTTPGRRGVVMSCPVGRASHNSGNWKPANLFIGIEAVAQQLVNFQSDLELVVVIYGKEAARGMPACENMRRKFDKQLALTCHRAKTDMPAGYGVSKVAAIWEAPLTEAIWLDCDTFPVDNLSELLDDESYQQTGAMFWADIEGHFDAAKLRRKFAEHGVDSKQFPLDAWWVKQGFDSGILIVHKEKCKAVLERLWEMGKDFKRWERYTSGDKDLWHIAWMLHGQDFTYVPYVGATGFFRKSNKMWYMTSQAKYGTNGKIYVLHQMWRSNPDMNADNFHGLRWKKLHADGELDENSQPKYNTPEITIRIDLRTNPDFKYAREEPDWWDKISDSLTTNEMYSTSNYIRYQTSVMAALWKY
eukprot:m.902047 g.902047  ORF g.902047 m.902047 type:complete len:464 (+) comp23689_c3_seq22:324-1715(+)